MSFLNILLAFITGATAIPFLLPILVGDSQTMVSAIERGIGYAFLALSFGFLVRNRPSQDLIAEAATIPGTLPPHRRIHYVLLIVFLSLTAHLIFYTVSARASMFLADQDITNISSAIANTASGAGLMPTAYVRTGDAGSYLGHHFAPALLLLLPAYLIANVFTLDHFIYPIGILVLLIAGLLVWIRILFVRFKNDSQAVLLSGALLLNAFPLLRLGQSFHNEAFVILFSGLAFLGLETRRLWLFYSGMILWMMVKEDTSVYLGLFGAFLVLNQISNRSVKNSGGQYLAEQETRHHGLALGIIALLYFLCAHVFQGLLGGKTGPDWTVFFHGSYPQITTLPLSIAKPMALLWILGAFAFLPLARPLFALIVLLPISILHLISNHPWHGTYYGHYAYAILPFLMYGSLLGIDRLTSIFNSYGRRHGVLCLLLGVSFYFNASDRQTPGQLFRADPEFEQAKKVAQGIPEDACVLAEPNLSPLVPVNRIVFPLAPVEGNPNTRDAWTGSKKLAAHCKRHVLFSGFKSDPEFAGPGKILKEEGRFSLREID